MAISRKVIDGLIDVVFAPSPIESVGKAVRLAVNELYPDEGNRAWEEMYLAALARAVKELEPTLRQYAGSNGVRLDKKRVLAALRDDLALDGRAESELRDAALQDLIVERLVELEALQIGGHALTQGETRQIIRKVVGNAPMHFRRIIEGSEEAFRKALEREAVRTNTELADIDAYLRDNFGLALGLLQDIKADTTVLREDTKAIKEKLDKLHEHVTAAPPPPTPAVPNPAALPQQQPPAIKEQLDRLYELVNALVAPDAPAVPQRPPQPPPAAPDVPPPPPPSARLSSKVPALLPAPFEWKEIPGGRGTMATDESNVTLSIPSQTYWMAKYPVTNAQYAKFIEEGGYSTERWWTADGLDARRQGIEWDWNGSEWKRKAIGKPWGKPRYWTDATWNGAEQPVVGVSWYEAVAFCRWLSERTGEKIMLPTEAQWQYAAQGDDGRAYPWDNSWDAGRCNNNVGSKGIGRTTPVRQYEGKGDSRFGVVDMAGNVWEWCLTAYDTGRDDLDGTDRRVLRGGSWVSSNTGYFRCVFRLRSDPGGGNLDGGFRLALSP
jgi:formylglycine-generating enzyme required for sulfatase activity